MVWRPSNGYWYWWGGTHRQFGTSGDMPVPGDFNGDGRADMVLFRSGRWTLDVNRDGAGDLVRYWGSGGVPVRADVGGDGKDDLGVWRRGDGRWLVDESQEGERSTLRVAGDSEPLGWSQKVLFDERLRTTATVDAAGFRSTQEWDAGKDMVLASTTYRVDGTPYQRETTLYDAVDRPTDSYGPAPAEWFGARELVKVTPL